VARIPWVKAGENLPRQVVDRSREITSGDSNHEQGISRAGNRHVRVMAVELAWIWVRHQPKSKITQWYLRRFVSGGSRPRKVGIVALARRLLIELWRFLETGVIPEGAVLKAAA
jgi:transposase